MEAALQLLSDAVTAVEQVDVATLSPDDLVHALVGLQRIADRVRVAHATVYSEAERAGVWTGSGHRNMAAWHAAATNTSYATTRRQAELGDALATTPALAAAVTAGTITPDAAHALLPTLATAHSGDLTELIEACTGATPSAARDAGALFQQLNPPRGESDREREHRTRQRRYLRFSDNGDGTVRLVGLLPVLDARILRNTLTHLSGPPVPGDDRTPDQRHADAIICLADAYTKGALGGGREAPTIIVTIDVDVLEARTPGAGYTATGEIIPAEIVRRMCTNANLVRLLTSRSRPLDIGRRQRLANNHQYRALVARDGGCRMPGCTIPANWCEIDHIQEWDAQHGTTDLDNLVLWCVHHHHYRHRPDVHLHGDANNLTITLPDGRTIPLPARGPTSLRTAA